MVLPTRVGTFRQALVAKLEAERSTRTALSHELLAHLFDEGIEGEKRLVSDDEQRTAMGQHPPECPRLLTVPGIGPLTATALVAAVSDAKQFHHGRQWAAWLGLVPRQPTTGGKERLLGISKRGDGYRRKLLVHGARATVQGGGRNTDRRRRWIRQLVERRGKNRTAVAVANTNARMAWVLLSRQHE